MNSRVIKVLIIYAVQVGTLWGLLESYTYFKGSALKDFLGPYWLIIYILPLFTTAYAVSRGSGEEGEHVTIRTQGDFSPGKVGHSYLVGVNQEDTAGAHDSNPANHTAPAISTQNENISTVGHFSPGKVGGSYSAPAGAGKLKPTRPYPENQPPVDQAGSDPQTGKGIHTKGDYSPGEVGGDYKVER